MNAQRQTTAANQSSDANSTSDSDSRFSALDANNFIRGNEAACLIIRKTINNERIETVFITVDRTYFRITEHGRPAKVERHTMSNALETARNNGHDAQLQAYPQSSLDISSAIEVIHRTFDLEAEDSNAGFGIGRDTLDNFDDDHTSSQNHPPVIHFSDCNGEREIHVNMRVRSFPKLLLKILF